MPSPFDIVAGRWGAVRLAAVCLAVLVAVRILLLLRGYGAVRSRIPRAGGAAQSRFYARRLGRHIERIGAAMHMSCLVQALALRYLLARSGHACTIRIGVRETGPGRFTAHAWVACGGVVVLGHRDTPLQSFTPLTELA
ncbi:MAG TPA: lasso peptide biosynthesis B2 protein [Novosphingobium sp.]|nr:lasso peptide biosynthesis B2 protein [Novosphingobium sp.]